jgi:hypothetical protein
MWRGGESGASPDAPCGLLLREVLPGVQREAGAAGGMIRVISLLEVLHELRAEKSRIDKAIAQIESRLARQQRSKRGRKGMGTEERKVVSIRMKHYWEQRRRAQA